MRAHAGVRKAIDTKQEVVALIRCQNVASRWSSERRLRRAVSPSCFGDTYGIIAGSDVNCGLG